MFTLTPAIASTLDKKKLPNGWFEARIDVLLGADVHRVLWKSLADTADANCFDLAMWGRGIVSEIKHVLPAEFNFMERSPQCRALGPTEPRKTGDLLSIRLGDDRAHMDESREVHAAVYISDELFFTKNGSAPISIATPANVYGTYLNGQSVDCSNPAASSLAGCLSHAVFFRCESTTEFRAKMPPAAWTEDVKKFYAELEPLVFMKENENWSETLGENADSELTVQESYSHPEVYRWSDSVLDGTPNDFTAAQLAEVKLYLDRLPASARPAGFSYSPPDYPKAFERGLLAITPDCARKPKSAARVECAFNANRETSAFYVSYVRDRIASLVTLANQTAGQARAASGDQRKLLDARLHLLFSLYFRVRSVDMVKGWFDADNPALDFDAATNPIRWPL